MKVLIVYDSFFGNTEKIAQEIAKGVGGSAEVQIVKTGAASAGKLRGADLVVVGSPTRGFRPSDETRAFLSGLAAGSLQGMKVAAFDTRIALETIKSPIFRFIVNLGGYAAKPIAQKLQKSGGTLVAAPEGFFVNASEGPLKDGELERAGEWGKKIVC